MAYQGLDGLTTVFPTAPRGRAPAPSRPARVPKVQRAKGKRPKAKRVKAHAGLVKRFDPVTGKRVWVPKDSDQADSYPTRKPKLKSRFQKAQDVLLSPAGGEIARAALPVLRSPGKTAVKLAAALKGHAGSATAAAIAGASKLKQFLTAAPKVGGIAATVGGVSLAAATTIALAGTAAYYGTTWILDRIQAAKDKKQAARNLAADAYRQARLAAAKKLGRELRPAELAQLAAAFKASMAQLG